MAQENFFLNSSIAATAIIKQPELALLGKDVEIHDFVILNQRNYYQDIFKTAEEKQLIIEDKVIIYPWAIVFEGARIGREVILEERTSVGSKSYIGARTRVVYQAQVNDNSKIGSDCIIGGFVADNCHIGNGCSIFGSLIHRYNNGCPTKWDTNDEQGPVIEDDVVVGWGAVIIGAITLGKGCRIFPNSVVTQSVEAYEQFRNS